jgi:hypothetical protein
MRPFVYIVMLAYVFYKEAICLIENGYSNENVYMIENGVLRCYHYIIVTVIVVFSLLSVPSLLSLSYGNWNFGIVPKSPKSKKNISCVGFEQIFMTAFNIQECILFWIRTNFREAFLQYILNTQKICSFWKFVRTYELANFV